MLYCSACIKTVAERRYAEYGQEQHNYPRHSL